MLDEITLIQLLKQKNQLALEYVLDTYTAYIYTIVKNVIGTQMKVEDIEEVVSDVFILLWNNSERILEDGKLKSYLAAIARNQSFKKLRDNNQTYTLNDDTLVLNEFSDPIKETEQKVMLEWALSLMTDLDKQIFIRYYFYMEKTYSIAEQLNMNESTVRSKLSRGRNYLKQILSEGGHQCGNKNITNV